MTRRPFSEPEHAYVRESILGGTRPARTGKTPGYTLPGIHPRPGPPGGIQDG